VNIFGGQFANEVAQVYDNVHLSMSGGVIGGVTIGASVFDWFGGQILNGTQFIFNGGSHNNGTINVYGTNFQIVPFGSCGFLDESSWVAAPLQLSNNVSGCVRGQLTDGSTFVDQYNIGDAGGSLNFIQAAVVPVPAAVWLFSSGLIGLLGMSRKRRR
jgi:hypothetical protein